MKSTLPRLRNTVKRLGPTFVQRRTRDGRIFNGIQFAVFSTAPAVNLEIYRNVTDPAPISTIPMKPVAHPSKVGRIYSVSLREDRDRVFYTYNANGHRLLDPCAPALVDKPDWTADGKVIAPRCVAYLSTFDWQEDKPPNIPLSESVIYEVLVSGFTEHHSSGCNGKRGTFAGLIRKLPHLKRLGITTVELMPIFEWDPRDVLLKDPTTGTPLSNVWGYNTLGFFAPEANLSHLGRTGEQIDEFKRLVQECHRAGMEVILDIVINHTREGNQHGPVLSFKGLANEVYYLLQDGSYNDWTGCGNTLNTNHLVVQQFIISCLRYWVEEMHVDGFRFDLAAVFTVGTDQRESWEATEIIKAIESDRVLSRVKLIAEPWTTRHSSLPDDGQGPFSQEKWARWNDKAQRALRRWVKGDMGQAAHLQRAIQSTAGDIVYVTCHDGFTLLDLVCYNEKHNWANGEGNADGSNDNLSWNCGFEGRGLKHSCLAEQERRGIWALRKQQKRNLLALLFLCKGTPMVLYGDEMGRSQNGNNNAAYQAGLTLVRWDLENKHKDTFSFMQGMIALRQRHRLWERQFIWHGVEPNQPDFSAESRVLAWEYTSNVIDTEDGADDKIGNGTGKDIDNAQGRIYVVNNAYWENKTVRLPEPKDGCWWYTLVDTSLPGADAMRSAAEAVPVIDGYYGVRPRSTVILLEK